MSEGWRELRVFISSTFRDMQAERDHLVRFVFPRVREKLLPRRLRLVDVDLRWGVTADQDAFDLCMREIDLCRPRFIAMLGGRYGWVPPPRVMASDAIASVLAGSSPAGELSAAERQSIERIYDLRERPARLRDKPRTVAEVNRFNADSNLAVSVFQRAELSEAGGSITAAEVLHGALDKLEEPLFRFFYFRDPAVTAAIPDPYAADYREANGSFAGHALDDLKRRIERESGVVHVAPGRAERRQLPVFLYPARWDDRTHRITSLTEFGNRVEADILASVDAELGPVVEPLTGFAAERAAMDAFIESRTQRYVVGTRKIAFEELDEHASGEGTADRLMVLVGEPGSGKSAMLARFVREHQRAHPDYLLITHFVGASAASTNIRQMLRRLWHELVEGAGLARELAEVPDDWDKLRDGFSSLLSNASESLRTVIVIDAVNQLDPAHDAHTIRWLPEDLPPNVRVILSVLPGSAFESLQKRRVQPRFSPIGRLSEKDASEIILGYLERYRKSLDPEQSNALLAKRDAGNPLYLLTALEELRTLGTYEEITTRIRELPGETQPLLIWILRRLESDDGFRDNDGELNGPHVVRTLCSSIAVSRSGMAEWELAELASDSVGNTAALIRLLRPYLMYRGDLLDFFHGQIREAARTLYLGTDAEGIAAHHSLAELFRKNADPDGDATWTGAAGYPRGVSELPFHLAESRVWDALENILTDLAFLEAKCTYVAVRETGDGEEKRRVYGGVYELQEDYRHALEVFPS